MNRLFTALLISALFPISFEAAAQGKFCVVTNLGQSCIYQDIASCQSASRIQGGICSVNQTQQPAQPPVRFDPSGSYSDGYRSGAKDGRRLREAAAARQSDTINYSPPPTTFVEKCRALVAINDKTAGNIYGPANEGAVSWGAGTCFGYISGYINARKQSAERSGKSCSAPNDAWAVARQISAISDPNIVSSAVGLPALAAVAKSWQCE